MVHGGRERPAQLGDAGEGRRDERHVSMLICMKKF